jgi:excinuclease ABC subunit A
VSELWYELRYVQTGSVSFFAPIVQNVKGSHTTLLNLLRDEFGEETIIIDNEFPQSTKKKLNPFKPHTIEIKIATIDESVSVSNIRDVIKKIRSLGSNVVKIRFFKEEDVSFALSSICSSCGIWVKVLKPLHFNSSCLKCGGKGCNNCNNTGLDAEAANVSWNSLNFTDLQKLSVSDFFKLLRKPETNRPPSRLFSEIDRRINALLNVGLGYLSLNRISPSLSRGESQRVRLAVAQTSRLEDMLHILDEPTIGLSIIDTQKLLPVFNQLAGSVIYVEHDRVAAAFADHAIDLGPGAGIQGGNVIFKGSPQDLWKSNTKTGRYFSKEDKVDIPLNRPKPEKFITMKGVDLRNLKNIEISIPLNRSCRRSTLLISLGWYFCRL